MTYTASPTSINGPSFANPDDAPPQDNDQQQPSPAQAESPASHTPAATAKRSATAPMALSAAATMNNGQRALSGEQRSPVMNETLSVIDEHLTDINTPRGSMMRDMRQNDSSSEYSSHVEHRLSYINGQETDEEESGLHTLDEIRHWSPLQVAEWLEDVGVDRRQCEVFKEQEISGEVLLGMDQASVFMKEFDLGPIGPRLKIWQKIKALQQEVAEAVRNSHGAQDYSGSEHGSSNAGSIRHRSTSIGTVLPRIPSLMESNGGRPSSRQQLNRVNSQQGSAPGTPGSTRNDTRRPSAASVREMNQHRRHSSIEFANVPSTPTTPSTVQVTQATPTGHKKAPSFDRGWKMGDAATNGRPASSAQMRPMDPSGEDGTIGGSLKVATPDLDRGYFSGGEVENRKQRNVLRKGHSPSHSRTSSSGTDGRRLSAFKRHSRFGSSDSIREREFSEPTIFSSSFYSPTKRSQSARTASGPELRSSPKAINKERSQTVTKLDYGTPSIDAIASSPHLAEGEDTAGRASPPPAIQRYPKQRATGLRAISDALAGTLSGGKNPPASPNKDSPMNSPVRTGSSTPSQTSKSFDSGEAPPDVLRSATGNSMATTTSSGPKKKTKKETSAYQRGLENKPPSETIPGSDYSGWMKKRSSNMMTTWKTRLFVLKGRRLSYYYSEFDTAEKGLIDISGHRVLPANNERITGLHATITGAKSSPTSPHNSTLTTSAQTDAANEVDVTNDTSGMFIFKLVPPRSGLSKAVNFTKPTVHYFAVDNLQQGRLWMAALMKATIDRDESKEVISTYQQKTISLAKARSMQQRPPALMGGDEDEENVNPDKIDEEDEVGLAISGLEDEKKADDDTQRSGSIGGSEAASSAVPASVESEGASKE